MVNVLESFEENVNFSKLAARRYTFYKMIEHLEKAEEGYIIETGSAHDKNNWAGQGQSTLIWDWFIESTKKHKAVSIDITQHSVDMAKSQTSHVEFHCADSVKTLESLKDTEMVSKCRLLYLDSFDWSEEANLDSAFHHIAELATIWAKLPSGCMIVVDDRHGDMRGKHFMVEFFMDKLGIQPIFKEYQIGWVKP